MIRGISLFNKNELSQKLTDVGVKLLVETIPLIFNKKISYFQFFS